MCTGPYFSLSLHRTVYSLRAYQDCRKFARFCSYLKGCRRISKMYLWWSLFTLYLLTCLVTVTVDDSGLRCCVACYMYDPLSSAFNSLCLLSLLKRILIFFTCYFLCFDSSVLRSLLPLSSHPLMGPLSSL